LPVDSTSTPVSTKSSMARLAVGLLVSTSFIAEATVTIGWRGSSSKRRSAPTDIPSCASTRARFSATSANSSRADVTASSAIVATPSSDTGLGDHFAEIGQRLGPIDWAMLPIGAYSPRWFMEPQHMDPVEAAQGFEALGARHLLAMHWGTFRLTDEAIGEPPARLRAHWDERGLPDDRLWILDVGEPRRLR
jgi:L-ascorbate metabolism protein UlaG (beta-lactamase superfamily)